MSGLNAIKSAVMFVFLSLSAVAWADAPQKSAWKKIDVAPGTYQTTDGNDIAREITPSCSGGPVCTIDPATGRPNCRLGNKQFSFYFKPGKEEKLIVYFDGGGACWDSNTCVTGQQTPVPAYVPEVPNTLLRKVYSTRPIKIILTATGALR